MLRIWNSLPEDVVSAAHLSLFISRLLVPVNLNQFLIGKMCDKTVTRTLDSIHCRGVYTISTMEQMHHEKIGWKVSAGT